jgi:hypothetical protein
MADNDIILKIKVDKDKALQSVKEYTATVEALKAKQQVLRTEIMNVEQKQADLNKRLENGQVSAEAAALETEYYAKQLDEFRNEQILTIAETNNQVAALRGYQKELQNVLKQEEAANNEKIGSMTSLRAELSNLIKEYDNLGRTEREGAKGTELLNKITKLTDEIKKAEEATQRYQRNVGNYKSALEGAEKAVGDLKDGVLGFVTAGNPMLQMLVNTSMQLKSLKAAFGVAAEGGKMLGRQLLALMANPIVAFLAVVVAAVLALKNGIESSEERMNRFKLVMAPLQGLLDGVSKALGVVCGWLLSLIEATADSIMWLSRLMETLPLVGEGFKKGNKAAMEYIEIEKQRQEFTRLTRDEVVKSAEREREVSDLKAKVAEKDKYTNEERLAFLDQAIAVEREQAEQKKRIAEMNLENLKREAAMADNDAEMNDKLAEATAAVIRADTELSNKLRELNAQRVEASNAMAAEVANARKAEEDAIKAAEDAMNELITDSVEKQKTMLRTNYDRQIAEIKERLANESNLTAAAREALNQQIIAIDIRKNRELKAIDDEVAQKKRENDERVAAEQAELDKQKRIKKQQDEIEQAALELSIRIEQLYGDEEAILQAKLEAKQREIESLHMLEGESEQEFLLRSLQLQNEYTDMQQDIANRQEQIEKTKSEKQVKAYNDVMSAMSAMGEHSKALGKLSKVIGLAQIAVDTGKAISAGVAEAIKAGPFPANLAAIATTIATVMANMATAISSIKSAKFATGGLVEGAGSGTSDSIQARLSNGESVITALATSAFAPLLSAINVMGGGVPISVAQSSAQQMGEDMLARAVARGVANIRPIVSVEEINRVSSNVEVIENLATL